MKIGPRAFLVALLLTGAYVAPRPATEPMAPAPLDLNLVFKAVSEDEANRGSASPIARRDGKLYFLTAKHLGTVGSLSVREGSMKVMETIPHPKRDLALVVVEDLQGLQLVPLAERDARAGEVLFAGGWQLGRHLMVTQGYKGSGPGLYSTPTSFGSSGGPIVNAEGRLVGVAMSVTSVDRLHLIPHISFYQPLDLDWLRDLGVID